MVSELAPGQAVFPGQTTGKFAPEVAFASKRISPALPFLICSHNSDTKFTAAFDTVFGGEGVPVILTPIHAPNANAVAERFVRTVRPECLDKLLILNQAHLPRVGRIPDILQPGTASASSCGGGWARSSKLSS